MRSIQVRLLTCLYLDYFCDLFAFKCDKRMNNVEKRLSNRKLYKIRFKISFKFALWLYLSYGIYNLLLYFNERYETHQ